MRFVKRLFLILFGIVVFGIAAIFIIPKDQIAQNIVVELESQLDRDIEINGDIGLSVFPNLGVSLGDVRIGNAEWSTDDDLLVAERVSVGVVLSSLIGGDIIVDSVEAINARVFLHELDDGSRNWTFDMGDGEGGDGGGSSRDVLINTVAVSNASLTYLRGTSDAFTLEDVTASLSRQQNSESADIDMSLSINGEVLSAEIGFEDLDGFINGASTLVALEASLARARVTYDGQVSLLPTAFGLISVDVPNADRVMAALDQASTGIDGPVSFTGTIGMESLRSLQIRDGVVASSPFSGQVDLDLDLTRERPFISADIVANTLGSAASEGGSSDDDGGAEWSDESIDVSVINQFDGDIRLRVNRLFAGDFEFAPAVLSSRVENGRAVTTLSELGGYGGTVTGQLVVNNRRGLSMSADLNATQVDLKPLLTAAAEIDRFTGTADIQFDVLGSGNSMKALMNSLRGAGSLSVGSGTISGIDLDNLFRGNPTGGTTIFDSMAASWTIDQGVLTNPDLLMLLPSIESTGSGRIGLGQQNMDYTFVPSLKQRDGGATIFPVRIEGPWSDLRIYPDLEAIINQDLGEQVESLKEQARETVESEVRDRLGLQQPEEGEEARSLEEDVKDELRRELENLLRPR